MKVKKGFLKVKKELYQNNVFDQKNKKTFIFCDLVSFERTTKEVGGCSKFKILILTCYPLEASSYRRETVW